jgi:hypothetical protein
MTQLIENTRSVSLLIDTIVETAFTPNRALDVNKRASDTTPTAVAFAANSPLKSPVPEGIMLTQYWEA